MKHQLLHLVTSVHVDTRMVKHPELDGEQG